MLTCTIKSLIISIISIIPGGIQIILRWKISASLSGGVHGLFWSVGTVDEWIVDCCIERRRKVVLQGDQKFIIFITFSFLKAFTSPKTRQKREKKYVEIPLLCRTILAEGLFFPICIHQSTVCLLYLAFLSLICVFQSGHGTWLRAHPHGRVSLQTHQKRDEMWSIESWTGTILQYWSNQSKKLISEPTTTPPLPITTTEIITTTAISTTSTGIPIKYHLF